jgi:hypothetical protein
LQRYLDGEAIHARSYNLVARLSRALNKPSHREADLRIWAFLLLLFAGLFFCGHLVTFALIRTDQPDWLIFLSRAGALLLGGVALWVYHRRAPRAATPAERQVWLIWVGYLLAYGTSNLVGRALIHTGVLAAGPAAPTGWDEVVRYPVAATLSGLAFFVMGASFGGRYYVIGLAFFALAFLMLLRLEWSPVAYGLVWAVCLVAIARHLRRLGAEAGR